jgi:hypothetical protein
MLSEPRLQKIVKEVAGKRLKDFKLGRVLTQPTHDSEGNDALRIVFVLSPEAVDSISGEEALELLVDIHNGLMREGDDRFPIIRYSTEEELDDSDDQDDVSEDDA